MNCNIINYNPSTFFIISILLVICFLQIRDGVAVFRDGHFRPIAVQRLERNHMPHFMRDSRGHAHLGGVELRAVFVGEVKPNLLHNTETKMRDASPLDHPSAFQFNVLNANRVEQSNTQ